MTTEIDTNSLRPLERRVLEMHSSGVGVDEIGARFNKSPEFVTRVLAWTDIPRRGSTSDHVLRPVERRVLAMRSEGETYEDIAAKFQKTERYIRQVEGLAHFKEGQRILSGG